MLTDIRALADHFLIALPNINNTLDNILGEVLTDICALVDQFLITLPNINTGLWTL